MLRSLQLTCAFAQAGTTVSVGCPLEGEELIGLIKQMEATRFRGTAADRPSRESRYAVVTHIALGMGRVGRGKVEEWPLPY